MDKVRTADLQKVILNIFKAVDRVCKNNDIRYYAIGGTCLGAVRHKGFIPWDDDLDIAMPRKDYERFISVAENELPDNLRLYGVNNTRHYENMFIKVHDINTTFIQIDFFSHIDRYAGVFVDIMPLDGLPANKVLRNINFAYSWILGRLNINRRFGVKFYHKGISLLIWSIIDIYMRKKPCNYFYEKREALLKKYDFDNSFYSCYGWDFNAKRILFPSSDFKNHINFPFEDYCMRCPVGYDHFLTTMFGDYMKFPPKEE